MDWDQTWNEIQKKLGRKPTVNEVQVDYINKMFGYKHQVDMSELIVEHCTHCPKNQSEICSRCFFGSVDFGHPDLGSKAVYNRAFKLLLVYKVRGFKAYKRFGNYLEIPSNVKQTA